MSNKTVDDCKVNNEDVINELTKDLEASLLDESIGNPTIEAENVIEPNDDESPSSDEHPDFILPNSSRKIVSEIKDDFDKDERSHSDDSDEDEQSLRDLDGSLTPIESEVRRLDAEKFKNEGNDKFKSGDYEESLKLYTRGLKICPLEFNKDRAMLYSNRAATKMKLKLDKKAIDDCTKAIENDPTYIKAYFRRAQCYEATDSLDESLSDFNKVLELDPTHNESRRAVVRLPPLIEERNERLKTEMMSKLKDLGNLVLKPFGLSTENFKLTQDPDTKGYSINFQQKK